MNKKLSFLALFKYQQHGIRNNIQRYKCNICHKTFTYQQKLNTADIWFDYSQGKQTYRALVIKNVL